MSTVTYRNKKTNETIRFAAPVAPLEKSDGWERVEEKAAQSSPSSAKPEPKKDGKD